MDFNVDLFKTYAAALAAVSGGVGIKILEKLLSKRDTQFSDATQIRDELREEVTALREEVESYKKDAADWRQKYYDKVEESLAVRTELETLRAEFEVFRTKSDSHGDDATDK